MSAPAGSGLPTQPAAEAQFVTVETVPSVPAGATGGAVGLPAPSGGGLGLVSAGVPAAAPAFGGAASGADDLTFQSFTHSPVLPEGKIQGSAVPPPSDGAFQDTDRLLPGGSASASSSSENASFYELSYYKPYFDVDTMQVLRRLLFAFWPFRTTFLEDIRAKPDLYGPFWVSTTLIFLMAALSNFASWLVFTPTATQSVWQYDFTRVTFAAATIYCYVSLLPLMVYLALSHADAPVSFAHIICVYGYAMVVFVPAQLICIIPSEVARWLAVFGAGLISGGFIAASLGGIMRQFLQKRALIVGGVCILLHGALCVVMKFFFFDFVA